MFARSSIKIAIKTIYSLAVPVLWLGIVISVTGQTRVSLRSQSKDIDFSNASSTRPVRTVTSLPNSCAVGDLVYKTDATPGENLYGCTGPDLWTQLSGALAADPFLQIPRVVVQAGTLSIGVNCQGNLPCAIRFGSVLHQLTAAATVASPAGGAGTSSLAYLYVRPDGGIRLGLDGASFSTAAVSGLTIETGVTSFPVDSFPLATCGISAGAFTNCTEYRTAGRDLLASADASILVTSNGANGVQSVGLNPAAVLLATADSDLPGLNRVNYRQLTVTLPNTATPGTVLHHVAMLAGGEVQQATAGTENRLLGICVANCGNTGLARIATRGRAPCVFTGTGTAGDYVQLSSGEDGRCVSAGTTRPRTGPVLGYLLTTFAGAGTFDVLLEETGANPNSGPAPVDYQSLALVLSSNPADSPGINELVQLGEDGVLRRAPEGATARLIGVCQANCGGSGPARIVTRGMASCVFDGPAEAGHYVQISASSAGQCHDAGASRPASGQVLGFVFGSVAASGPAPVLFEPDVR